MILRRLLPLAGLAALLAWTTQPARLTALVGLWTTEAGVITTDGARWSGSTSRAELEAQGRTIFGSTSDALVANGMSPGAFPLAVDRQTTSFTRGTVRVEFKLVSGPTDQSAGIVLGLQPDGSYHFVRYNTKDGNLALWGYANGERVVMAKGEGLKQLPLGAWHELVVRVEGQRVEASVTGHPVLSATFTLPATVQGRVGLWAKRDVVTGFRGFEVVSGR